ncbi:MAG: hypothetical protein ACLRMJ_10920 [Alistipes finegoldii]
MARGENMIDDTLSDVALDYYRTHTDDFAAAHKAYYYAAKIANQRRQPEVAMTLLLKSRDMLPRKGSGGGVTSWRLGSAYSAASSISSRRRYVMRNRRTPTLTAWSVTTGCAYRSATWRTPIWGWTIMTAWNTMRSRRSGSPKRRA